jgi:hypothetical protein
MITETIFFAETFYLNRVESFRQEQSFRDHGLIPVYGAGSAEVPAGLSSAIAGRAGRGALGIV